MTLETWSETRGLKPHRVTVFERVDKGLALYLRWYVGGKPKHEKVADPTTVRDSRGRTLKSAIEKAQAAADAKIRELSEGRKPRKKTGPLTLDEGVARAFSDIGPYPLDPERDAHTKRMKRYVEVATRYLQESWQGEDEVAWEDVTPGMMRGIWRRLARENPGGEGLNRAEKILVAFYRVSTWLQGENPDQRFPAPLKGWRGELRGHWQQLGHDIEPDRPPHTPEEVAKLIAHLPEADPRVALAFTLGAELRGGQVIRTMRSDCQLPAEGPWRLKPPQKSAKKRTPRLTLNTLERAALEAALTSGYLSELEAAFQRGEISDYPLFPAGRLAKGKVRAKEGLKPTTALNQWFHEFERAAGVEPVDGRGWHGVRRYYSDVYEPLTADERVKDAMGGWVAGSGMRRSVYQQQEDEATAQATSDLRARVRGGGD